MDKYFNRKLGFQYNLLIFCMKRMDVFSDKKIKMHKYLLKRKQKAKILITRTKKV